MKEDEKFYRRLAKVIKEERTKQNLTIKELAKRANLSYITISDGLNFPPQKIYSLV